MNCEQSSFVAAAAQAWHKFCAEYHINNEQQEKFICFGSMLLEWNTKHNLTAITDTKSVIADHFQDSLSITKFVDFTQLKGIADVGTGGGFPGIPLKIMFPALPVVLIEVNTKKIDFLRTVIKTLSLEAIEVCDLDWRTFIRKTSYKLDLFCARASLRPDELIRMFSDSSPYQHARLVYWASRHWKLEGKEQNYFEKEEIYTIDDKQRKLVFFMRKS